MASRSPCVTDTNVWIDLDIAGLTDLIFRLPLNLQAPDVIVAELERPDGETLAGRGLQVRELTGSQVLEVARLACRYLRPSRSDLFALVLARSQGATLLTGDRHLRSAAESEGVKVHGTIWLIDEMVRAGLLEQREAAARLLRMIQAGRRLPSEEVKRRLWIWEESR
jgi:predicted nucleic acid-binding protein